MLACHAGGLALAADAARAVDPSAASWPPSSDRSFVDALHERIGRDGIVPSFARVEIALLSAGQPMFAFGTSGGAILQLNLYGFPDPKGTAELVAPLIDAAVGSASRYAVQLNGIEIVFHRRRTYNPMQVWAAAPPWGTGQIVRIPLSTELIDAMKPSGE